MYGPVIFLLCARPGDDLVGASGAILRARQQGCIVTSYMLSNGLVQPPAWKFWASARTGERAEACMNTGRRIAVEYGHQFIGWNGARLAGTITPDIQTVARDIERAFVSIKPDVVWAPAFLGLDPDYDALNVIASRLPQMSSTPLDVYEYIPRPLVRSNVGTGGMTGARAHMVFPNRHGLELAINLTSSESAKRSHAIEAMNRVYDEPLPTAIDRELFRLMPEHDYARPPYGYKNPMMLRGTKPGAPTLKMATTRFQNLRRLPISRNAAGDAGLPLHHLPQG